jgi:putative transposase
MTEMRQIHADRYMKSYGSPRLHKELVGRGKSCCENTVARLMRVHGLAAKTSRKYKVTTDSKHSLPVAENVLNREFQQDTPDRVWLADITYIWTQEGWLYLAAVLDSHSRKIVGWSMSHRMQKSLVMDALRMALGRRCPDQAESLMHHSDRGSQYASQAFQDLLRDRNITCSMSRKANCWDNAMMESFFATLKKEQIHHESYSTREEARQSVFEYIELFYNTRRRHSALGYLSPEQFENAA